MIYPDHLSIILSSFTHPHVISNIKRRYFEESFGPKPHWTPLTFTVWTEKNKKNINISQNI